MTNLMKYIFDTQNKHAAETWMNVFVTREELKKAAQPLALPAASAPQLHYDQKRVVFVPTYNAGQTEEETSHLQQVYKELEELSWPSFSAVI